MLILTTSNDDNDDDNMLSVPPLPAMMYQRKGKLQVAGSTLCGLFVLWDILC